MGKVRSQIHQRATSGFLKEADAWTLVSDMETGARTVEHEWTYVDPFGQGPPDSGISSVSVETFLRGDNDDQVKQKLRALLVQSAEPGADPA